jgi:hypothetical protein
VVGRLKVEDELLERVRIRPFGYFMSLSRVVFPTCLPPPRM